MRNTLVDMGRLWLIVLMACTGSVGANLLINPDFETAGPGGASDPAGWDRSDTTIVKRWAETGQSGHGDWMVILQDNANTPQWAAQTFPATAGDEYAASAQFKGAMQAGETVSISMVWLDTGGAEIGTVFSSYTTGDSDYIQWGWVTRSVKALAPAGTVEVEVRVQSLCDGNFDSAIFADNAVFTTAPNKLENPDFETAGSSATDPARWPV